MRLPRASLALVAAVALGGCYGSTEPATEVTSESARLNARGTADAGPAYSRFEFWSSGRPDRKLSTPTRRWPAGASGPVSERIGPGQPTSPPVPPVPLSGLSSYSFRFCGNDEGRQAACAQTRQFTTPAPVRDGAKGSWISGPAGSATRSLQLDASAGTGGGGPSGTVSHQNYPTAYRGFSGQVSCLVVTGTGATVGARGVLTDVTTGASEPASTLVTVEDGGADLDPDRVGVRVLPFDPPPSCSTPVSPLDGGPTPSITVYDAP